ncbi:FecCD family ABC transporter permease [Pseudonocardia sp. HH130630-07]|uniref:FecCD family ABC transporter permease n=1 Tax=Pseudonocardia sp. HH130630-07 TaxID=1690815 RepID=UPI000814E6F5|nr:iron chelate uptake ABC transporter family permease subunit [Pseudonocardia sp. HH130630-07]ANY08862.1 ABC transporter permease [Pseudonocardia sp. HH130630-07]
MTVTRSGPAPATVAAVAGARRRRSRHRRVVVGVLTATVIVVFTVGLMVGDRFVPLGDVLAVVAGADLPGTSFTVGRLRLPRGVLAILVGACFGLGGVAFQTMLRNPLASPDIIGISAGASTAAAFAIVVLGLGATAVSVFAIVAGLAVALLIYLLAFRGGVAGTRLILVGIGIAAMLTSLTDYILAGAAQWDLQEALRWLTGSLNGASWGRVLPVLIALGCLGPVLLSRTRDLSATQLGDDTGAALGVRVGRARLVVVVAAVGLVAFGAAATGPIAFVAFLSGPIAARIVGNRGSLMVPAALVGALLVLGADLLGQHALALRYPVGVVTGVLGAPYLLYLIVRSHRAGAAL